MKRHNNETNRDENGTKRHDKEMKRAIGNLSQRRLDSPIVMPFSRTEAEKAQVHLTVTFFFSLFFRVCFQSTAHVLAGHQQANLERTHQPRADTHMLIVKPNFEGTLATES